ncbi:phosphatase PAP2 family protein [Bacillus carboniphilus]|uniref:Phosphatase PAP2 family protein n=1 Tax=Bacillus carboniphilus TaxID=86663 RepID=A0ABP3GDQ3_9BACI
MVQKSNQLYFLSLCLFLFTVLFTDRIIQNEFNLADQSVQSWAVSISNPIITNFMSAVTLLAKTEMLALMSATTFIYFAVKKYLHYIFLFLFVMGGGVVITFLMKISIERDRPGETFYVDFWGLGSDIISYSYPSGHAAKGLLFFGFLIYYVQLELKDRIIKATSTILMVLIIILIGFGQIILDRHYLSDVIGGYLVASAWILICLAVMESKRMKHRLGAGPPTF